MDKRFEKVRKVHDRLPQEEEGAERETLLIVLVG
jgi:hypothetical protein